MTTANRKDTTPEPLDLLRPNPQAASRAVALAGRGVTRPGRRARRGGGTPGRG